MSELNWLEMFVLGVWSGFAVCVAAALIAALCIVVILAWDWLRPSFGMMPPRWRWQKPPARTAQSPDTPNKMPPPWWV